MMSDTGNMPAAITITILAVLCTAVVFAILLASQRPEEGWRAWVRSTLTSWRQRELSWVEPEEEDAVGGLGALYQLSEPGHAYVVVPEELETRLTAVTRSRLHTNSSRRPSHAG